LSLNVFAIHAPITQLANGRPAKVIGGWVLGVAQTIDYIFRAPIPNFTEVKKSEIWLQFTTEHYRFKTEQPIKKCTFN